MADPSTETIEIFRSSDYDHFDEIDFQIIQRDFRKLPLFQDVYLNMQGLNLSVTDWLITQYEYQLLEELIETEKTPLPTATVVSALSQMWILSLYELLRTWKRRIDSLIKHASKGSLESYVSRLSHVSAFSIPHDVVSHEAKKLSVDLGYKKRVESIIKKFDELDRLLTAFRLNLAKQEVPGKPNVLLSAPGYGRINYQCGALDFQIYFDQNKLTVLNRRDIADLLRRTLSSIDDE